jgi:hypothetical protein
VLLIILSQVSRFAAIATNPFCLNRFEVFFHGGKEDTMSLDFRKEGFLLSGILVQEKSGVSSLAD